MKFLLGVVAGILGALAAAWLAFAKLVPKFFADNE